MSQLITTEFTLKYATTIEMLLQQKPSRLRNAVRVEMLRGAKAATPIEQIGPVVAQLRTTRYPSLTPNDTPHQRPWVFPADYDWNDMIDSVDKLRLIADPQGSYAQNGMYAMNRAMDDQILSAFFATRATGELVTSGTTAFPAAQQVAVNFGSASNVGLTVAKLREARRLLMAAEVDFDTDEVYIAVKGKQHDNLLAEIQIISSDFNERPVLTEGRITRFLGFNFIHSERLALNASSYNRVPVWAKSGVCLGIWNDVSVDISQRKDLAGLPMQVYVYGTFGATRLEEAKVVELICNPA